MMEGKQLERGETLRDGEGVRGRGKRHGGEEENTIRQCTAEKLHFVYCRISCHHVRRYEWMTSQIKAATRQTAQQSFWHVYMRGGTGKKKQKNNRTYNLQHLSLSQAKTRASVGEGSRYAIRFVLKTTAVIHPSGWIRWQIGCLGDGEMNGSHLSQTMDRTSTLDGTRVSHCELCETFC